MAQPTLQAVFGTNATQDANTITISKADLSTTGLTPAATNTVGQILAALVKKIEPVLSSDAQTANPDIDVVVGEGFDSLVTRNNQQYRNKSITISFQKLDAGGTLNPNDY